MKKVNVYFLLFLFWAGCEDAPKRMLVRPVEVPPKDSTQQSILPFDTYPYLNVKKKWFEEHFQQPMPDISFVRRIRVKNASQYPFDPNIAFPAAPLEVVMPDSVQFGNMFYYFLVMPARDGALFSRSHLEKKSDTLFQIRIYQQEVEGLPKPCSQYEEALQSFQPKLAGKHTFQFYFYDSLFLEKKVEVFSK